MFFKIENEWYYAAVLGKFFFVVIAMTGTTVRCCKYKNAGLNRLDAPRPRPYKVKVALQILLALFALATGVLAIIEEVKHDDVIVPVSRTVFCFLEFLLRL